MNLDPVRAVADAVLWEGYLLYPYRATAAKNQIRWQFGVLGPPVMASEGLAEGASMHAECPLRWAPGTTVDLRLRHLQLIRRRVQAGGRDVDQLDLAGRRHVSFEEATACESVVGPLSMADLRTGIRRDIEVAAGEEVEDLTAPDGSIAGRVVRRRAGLSGSVAARLEELPDAPAGWARLLIDVENTHSEPVGDRDAAIAVSFLGAHLLIAAEDGALGSVLEPPPGLEAAADGCRQDRCWPVLAGTRIEPGVSDVVLASPIILYDHPEVAPESAGELFDSTEIDEILTLRVMTMTDEEKREARATDPAAAAIIDRCDGMSPADLARLHGALRDPRFGATGPADPVGRPPPDLTEVPTFGGSAVDTPWWDPAVDGAVSPQSDTVLVNGAPLGAGALVRIRPNRRADAQDLFYAGRIGRVVSVYSDVDGNNHIAVVLEDDPAAELHEWYGRYLYFAPDEVEPMAPAGNSPSE